MNIVMLANNPCVFDARIRREAEALVEAGHRVTVVATRAEGLLDRERIAGVDYRRVFEIREIRKNLDAEFVATALTGRWRGCMKSILFRIGRRLVTPSMRHLVGYAYAYRATIIALDPDVVHAHDLDTLLAGWLGARWTGAKLVYDAHELETSRNLPMVLFERTYRALAEWWLIRRCDVVITVSDSIADYLAKRYRISLPVVVLNAPAEETVIGAEQGVDLRAKLGLSPEAPLALYVGGVMTGRGIEQAIMALSHLPALQLAALGPRDDKTSSDLAKLAQLLCVHKRLHFVDPVPPEQLRDIIASADMSLILIQNTCLSYRYCFPNKLLLSLLAGLPVVASRLVELERIVDMTGAGLVVDETDPKAIAEAIADILARPDLYRPDTAIIRSLKSSHGWQAQKQRLLVSYEAFQKAMS